MRLLISIFALTLSSAAQDLYAPSGPGHPFTKFGLPATAALIPGFAQFALTNNQSLDTNFATCTLTNAIGAGNWLIAFCDIGASLSTYSITVTDTLQQVWFPINNQSNWSLTAGNSSIQIWACPASSNAVSLKVTERENGLG